MRYVKRNPGESLDQKSSEKTEKEERSDQEITEQYEKIFRIMDQVMDRKTQELQEALASCMTEDEQTEVWQLKVSKNIYCEQDLEEVNLDMVRAAIALDLKAYQEAVQCRQNIYAMQEMLRVRENYLERKAIRRSGSPEWQALMDEVSPQHMIDKYLDLENETGRKGSENGTERN